MERHNSLTGQSQTYCEAHGDRCLEMCEGEPGKTSPQLTAYRRSMSASVVTDNSGG
jgi:hypothetical protein